MLPVQAPGTFVRRRRGLAEALGGTPALLFAGGPRARNYPGNPYRYRVDSHFLYLTGASLPGAVLWIEGDRAELFATPSTRSDALWHGPQPSDDEVGAAIGVSAVRPLHELGGAIEQAGGWGSIATLPSQDPLTRQHQIQALERRWPLGGLAPLEENDARLADAMIALRLVHDDAAVAMIEQALEGTAAAHLAGMAATAPGLLEHDVVAAMEKELQTRGCEPAYGSIVTIHGEILHNESHDHPLQQGELLLADVGGECAGWASDVTRTWPVSGQWSPTQRALYDIVLEANRQAIAQVRPGVRYLEVHRTACRVLARGLVDEGLLRGDPDALVERGAHALFFPHGVGHLLGLDVHDMEDLGDRAGYAPGRARSPQFGLSYLRLDRDLAPGMAVTIEPGLYFVPAILEDRELTEPFERDGTLVRDRLTRFADVRGIRIEDDVLCTTTEPRVLSQAVPKEADAVAASVGGKR